MRGFINGIVFTLALIVAAGFAAVYLGLVPANADGKPSGLERWAARTSLNATIKRETSGVTDPLQPTDDVLIAGANLYAANCAVCHGASDGNASKLARGFYIRAPQLGDDGVEDDPEAESFWKIKHGIRFTAMPAFTTTLSDDDMWKIATFLKHMDKLSPAADAVWKKIPSAASTPAPL
jgi:mono/diheme cytochrome c family protein